METKPLYPFLGKWWRHEKYEVADGYVRPLVGARVEAYDPFEAYYLAWESGGAQGPPHIEFARLDPRDEKAIVSWCDKHGLLGLLLFPCVPAISRYPNSEVPSLTYAPFFREVPLVEPEQPPHAKGTVVGPLRPVGNDLYWAIATDGRERLREAHVSSAELAKELLSERERWLACAYHERTAPYFPWLSGWTTRLAYLPEKRRAEVLAEEADLRYPEPFTPEFWAHYQEPLDRFRRAVEAFRGEMEFWRRLQEEESGGGGGEAERWFKPWAGPRMWPDFFTGLRGCVPGLTFEEGKVRERWWYVSLLSALYGMMRLDLLGGKVVRYCGHKLCRRPFLTDRRDKHYCSAECRDAAEVARRREFKAAVLEALEEGTPAAVSEVASRLGAEEDRVRSALRDLAREGKAKEAATGYALVPRRRRGRPRKADRSR